MNGILSAMKYSTITTSMKRFSLLSISTLLLSVAGFSQFQGLESEVYSTSEHGTTYHIYAHFDSPTDEVLAIYSIGSSEDGTVNLELDVTTSFYQELTYGVDFASNLFGFISGMFPDVAYDSWLTIGSTSNTDPTVANIGMSGALSDFNAGSGFTLDGNVGGSWYVTPGSNALAMAGDNGKVLLAQLTAADSVGVAGHVMCNWNINWLDADGNPHYEQELVLNTANFIQDVLGCMDTNACNYDEEATADNDTCEYIDACGVCGGDGILEGACDCDGTQPEEGYDCEGDCTADADNDGVCDLIDPCVGTLDICGVCNGPGDVYACGCGDVPEDDCDCDGNQADAAGECGGACLADADADGICDDIDECVGLVDACGVCNGPGDIYECGCIDMPEGDCDCNGNQTDASGNCGGECTVDLDEDGICDDIDECVGDLDVCGICNGQGSIYDCGCSDIPEGDCDCDGNQADATGECGGACLADADADGICDDIDECVGLVDICGVCNGPGDIYECGCIDMPEGDCDCNGNQVDALGVCGGSCGADADNDGVCDAVEILGCTDELAINFQATATEDDGSCEIPAFPFLNASVHTTGDEGTTYRLYAHFESSMDESIALFAVGSDESAPVELDLSVSTNFFQQPIAFGGVDLGSSIQDFMFGMFPDLEYDSWLTVGSASNSDGDVSSVGMSDAFDSFNQGLGFTLGGTTGGSWYVIPGSNGAAVAGEDGKVLVGQFTVAQDENGAPGILSGSLNMQWRAEGQSPMENRGLEFTTADWVAPVTGCTDEMACNFDAEANTDDDSCLLTDECGICGGDGIAEGDCDCEGNGSAEGYDCDGICLADMDGDGTCDEFEVAGCTDASACNYDADATDDDNSCQQLDACDICGGAGILEGSCGCDGTFPEEGYDCDGSCLIDTDEDGVCDSFEISGCTASAACNYNVDATDDDGSCEFAASGTNCDGNCINDHDGDGICNEFEFAGCTSSSASNYNSEATDDDGSCAWGDGLFTGLSYELVGNDLVEGTSTYRLFANFDADTIIQVTAAYGTDLDPWSISSTESFYQDENGSLLAHSINPDFFTFFPTLAFDSWLALGGTPGSPIELQTVGLESFFTDFEASGADVLVNTAVGASLYYIPGNMGSPLSFVENGQMLLGQFTTAGVVSVSYNLQFRDAELVSHYATDLNLVFPEFGVGCTDTAACNYAEAATHDDGTCYYESEYRDCEGMCNNDADGDNICDEEEIPGCTDEEANNFDPAATDEDGTCLSAGCFDELACNYNPDADVNDPNTCVYPEPFADCDGNCNGDYDGDGIEECAEVTGCASESANNFDPLATNDDGSCEWGDDTFQGLIYELVEENTIEASTTYRVYAQFDTDAAVDMTSLFGNAEDPWLTTSTESFYQHPFGADFGGNINPGFYSLFPELEYDSWLTIGASPGDYNALAQENMYIFLPEFNLGNDLIVDTEDGAQIFLNPGASDTQGVPDENGRLLVGQFTTSGVVFLRYNIRFEGTEDQLFEYTDVELTFPAIDGGCSDEMASNFDPSANFNDLSCIYEGCSDETADNYNSASNFNDGSCLYSGCMDSDADNYDAGANVEDGTCLYTGCMDSEADNYDTQANMGDQGSLCEYSGCTNAVADNYDGGANVEDGSCLFTGCMDVEADNYYSLANTGDQESLCEYSGCTDAEADNYDAGANMDDESCLYSGCMNENADNYNAQANTGDQDAICLFSGCMDELAMNYNSAANTGDQDSLCEYSGCTDSEADNYDAGANVDDNSCLYTGCMNDSADNYDAQANTGDQDAICLFSGCMDEFASNYSSGANTGDQDVLCEYLGCTNEDADNYNIGANVDDGSCVVAGCSYDSAVNYSDTVTYDDGSCVFLTQGCMDVSASNYNPDAGMDNDSCLYGGCTNASAINYNAASSIDDGSCEFVGCMDELACNYDDNATADDGSCLIVGCMDMEGLNYDFNANFPGGCDYPDACPGDINGDLFVDVSDLLTFFQYYGTPCPE